MWDIVLLVNSILLAIASFFLIYTFGTAILFWEWERFGIVLVLTALLAVSEVALGAIST